MWIDSKGNKWFKGNIHTHTARSDGRMGYDEAVELFKNAGYDFLAVTDHWKWSEGEQREGILLLPGCEYDVGRNVREGIYHIVGIGCREVPALHREDPDLCPQKFIDEIHRKGGFAQLAHPAWSLTRVDNGLKLRDLDAVEIYNTTSGLPHNARPYSGDFVDLMASFGSLLPVTAVDDCHWYDGDEAKSYILVQAEALTEESILEALKAGRFLATQGPTMEVSVCDGYAEVRCSEAASVVFFSDAVWIDERSVRGEGITFARHKIASAEHFIRVEVTDAEGRTAWSSPIPVN